MSNISDSNRSVFQSLTEGQRARILSASVGTNVEGVNVTDRIQFELRQWEMETQVQSNNNNTVTKNGRTYDLVAAAKPRLNTTIGDKTNTVRYPSKEHISDSTDYVSIDFFNYQPPFGRGEKGTFTEVASDKGMGQLYENYHHSIGDGMLKNSLKDKGYKSILLFMPEDVQAQYGANWGGAGIGVGQANLAKTIGTQSGPGKAWGGTWEASRGGIKIAGYSLAKWAMNNVMGGSMTTNQLMGGVSGTIVNPNVELMYEAPELRGFNLNFKMMPRSPGEAHDIFSICQTLKKAMLPSWGGQTKTLGMAANERTGALLTIPKIVSVKFMTGSKLNPYVSQFKPCAITSVNINYTPDGSYATYSDGSPVATMLQVSFKELKLVFEQEVPLSDSPVATY